MVSSQRSSKYRRTVTLGLDFGAHSTKAVYRERGRDDARVAVFDEPAHDYPPAASPSLVRFLGGRLYFGTSAERSCGGTLYRFLKKDLLEGKMIRPEYPPGLSCLHLIAAYLAWALHRLRSEVEELRMGRVLLNVGAPMSHIENVELKMQYLRIVQAAWKTAYEDGQEPIRSGVPLALVRDVFRDLGSQRLESAEERLFDVLPETIAPIVSLSLDPFMDLGMYFVLDMGAATTEMSVFHIGEPSADAKVVCYKDDTMVVGTTDFARDQQSVLEELVRGYKRVWYEGYQKDARNPVARRRWRELKLVLSGGGTRDELIRRQLEAVNPVEICWQGDSGRVPACRHVPETLYRPGSMSEGDASMFAVANGLALERAKWPVVFAPSDVEPLGHAHEKDEPPDPFWYLD